MIPDLDTLDRRADALVDGHVRLLRDLVAMRTAHGLTQAEVAERMGVSQPTVAAFERYDANPTLSTLRRYALAVEARMETAVIDECADDAPSTAPGSAEAQPVTSRPAR
jgi:transcriptional regulator with XRE-family HTH domain